jgi:hypothetical protein
MELSLQTMEMIDMDLVERILLLQPFLTYIGASS